MLKVGDLKAILENFDDDAEVLAMGDEILAVDKNLDFPTISFEKDGDYFENMSRFETIWKDSNHG